MKKLMHIDELIALNPHAFSTRNTTLLEKALPSVINAIFCFGIATPVLLVTGPSLFWKCSVIVVFALYEACMFLWFKDRCFGMKIMDTYFLHHFKPRHHVLYNIFYTASFATCLFSIWFPFDLLLLNLLAIQLPCILITGTTFHGWISGVRTVAITRTEQSSP